MHLRTSAVQQQQHIAHMVVVTDCIAKNTTIPIAKTSSFAIIEILDASYKRMMRIIFAPFRFTLCDLRVLGGEKNRGKPKARR